MSKEDDVLRFFEEAMKNEALDYRVRLDAGKKLIDSLDKSRTSLEIGKFNGFMNRINKIMGGEEED
jgi:hypothetical protein